MAEVANSDSVINSLTTESFRPSRKFQDAKGLFLSSALRQQIVNEAQIVEVSHQLVDHCLPL
jgi:hypothetical protein